MARVSLHLARYSSTKSNAVAWREKYYKSCRAFPCSDRNPHYCLDGGRRHTDQLDMLTRALLESVAGVVRPTRCHDKGHKNHLTRTRDMRDCHVPGIHSLYGDRRKCIESTTWKFLINSASGRLAARTSVTFKSSLPGPSRMLISGINSHEMWYVAGLVKVYPGVMRL